MKRLYNLIYDKHINIILTVFIISQPILDILVSISIWSGFLVNIGIILRGLFLAFAFIYLLSLKSKKIKIYLFALSLYVVINLLLSYLDSHSLHMLTENTKILFKIFYLPILIIFFHKLKPVISTKVLLINLLMYCGFLIFALLFKLGKTIYLPEEFKEGYVGLFYSGNEVSAIIIALYSMIIFDIMKKYNMLINVLIIGLVICASVIIGTKVAFFGTALIIAIALLSLLVKKIKEKKIKLAYIIPVLLLLIVVGIIIFPKTPVYKNYLVAIKFYKINNAKDLATNIDNIIFSKRLSYLETNNVIFNKTELSQRIIGYNLIEKYEKHVEIDYFDILFFIGYIGFLLCVTPVLYMLYKIFKYKLMNKWLVFTLILLLLIAFCSGHVLFAPAVSIYIAIILSLTDKYICDNI